MKPLLRVLLLLVTWAAFGPTLAANAQICANSGKDGSGALTTNPSTYYPGTATAAAGAMSISVGTVRDNTTPAIPNGDLLLVVQMQAADISVPDNDSDGVAGGAASGYLNDANCTAGPVRVCGGWRHPVGGHAAGQYLLLRQHGGRGGQRGHGPAHLPAVLGAAVYLPGAERGHIAAVLERQHGRDDGR